MKYLSLLLLSVLSLTAGAQNIGLHPPEINWQQLRAENVRVLFPAGYEARARRVASLIDKLAVEHNRSVGDRLYDFDLVLQTPNMTVNGYVGLAPFRSEFYTTPPQSFSRLSNTDWLDLLSIHEFRHVQQTSNERRGLTRLGSILQGQLGWTVLSGMATPNWFTEGDAVVAETALTTGGRGRTPAFSSDLRALLQSNRVYRYAKARNGSFRNLVPSHYVYGYAMTTFARERFGNDVWRPVLQEGAAYRSPFYSFSRALKRRTGLTTRALYANTMLDLERLQDSALAARRPLLEGDPVATSSPGNDIRNYSFPFVDEEGRLLALRTSYRQLPAIVEVGERDRIITRTGIQREPWVAIGKRFALWTQYGQNPRYTNQNYSDIVVYELSTGRKRQLTHEGHYVSASFSPDERRLATVWFDALAGGPELRILDAANGTILQSLELPENNATWPTFSSDGEKVYFLGQTYAGVAIEAWNLASGSRETVYLRSAAPIDMLKATEDGRLLFVSGRSGVDNVYTLDPVTGEDRPLTDVAIGAYFPHLAGDTLYYAAPTPEGERLHRLTARQPLADEAGNTAARSGFFERPRAYLEEAANLPLDLTVTDYPTGDFSNTLGGIKLHSWSFNGSYVTPGVAIEAGNALNTISMTLSGEYNFNEDRYGGGIDVAYGGLYPVIELEGRYRDRNTTVQENRSDSLQFFNQEFNQLTLGATVSVPLQWVSGNTTTSVMPSLGYHYYSIQDLEEGRLPADFSNLSLGVNVNILRRTAYRQVQPRWGATANLLYDRALGQGEGERFLLRSSVYVPGLFRTHGIRLDFDTQYEPAVNLYQYPDVFRYARGFRSPLNDGVYRIGANYHLPLLYPDVGILGITYFKRIRLNAFYDYSQFSLDFRDDLRFTEQSVGGQLYFDNVWLNTQLITIGVQAAYRLSDDLFSADGRDLQFQVLVSGSF
ncbi:TolB family protein [Lewinella sp. IMCC34191]|uniref:TolB family protein n=1 Tax=Lewinella sp. IMCC34191 TaxID=2259172 RepID=UPI000E2645E3|nr:PD40 domain-containing protein [Lewinella sp. IMCC34191]